MDRQQFRTLFGAAGPALFPVIHVVDEEQIARNVEIVAARGVAGVFLINHDFAYPQMLPMIAATRRRFPDLWLGVNFLAVGGAEAFPVLAGLEREGVRVDAYWADDARIDERAGADEQFEARETSMVREASGWRGLYFGGTAFKKQRPVAALHFAEAARLAARCMDVVTTSGPATGKAADLSKIEAFRAGCGDAPLAVASGVSADNAAGHAGLVDAILVATGINRDGDFYNFDPAKLDRLCAVLETTEAHP